MGAQGNLDDLGDSPWIALHDRNAVGQKHRLIDAMGDQQRRGALFHPDPLQLDVHASAQNLIEGAEGLIQQQHRRIGHQRTGNCDALTHAAGKLPRSRILEALQADQRDQPVDPIASPRGSRAPERLQEAALIFLAHCAPWQQRRILECDAKGAGAAFLRRCLTADLHGPGIRALEARDNPQQRGLTAPRRTDQRGEGARRAQQGHLAQGENTARVHAEGARHAGNIDVIGG